MNTSEKYWWVFHHPKLNPVECDGSVCVTIEIEPHMVCPETNRIEDLEFLNTKEQIWIEMLIPSYDNLQNGVGQWHTRHDYAFDAGGDTLDEALEDLVSKVKSVYGDYTQEELHRHTALMYGDVYDDTIKKLLAFGQEQEEKLYDSAFDGEICDSEIIINGMKIDRLKKVLENAKDIHKRETLTREQREEVIAHFESERNDLEACLQSNLSRADFQI